MRCTIVCRWHCIILAPPLTLSAIACTCGFYAPVPHLHLMSVLFVLPPVSLLLGRRALYLLAPPLTLSAVACTCGFYAPVPHLHLMVVLFVPPSVSLQLGRRELYLLAPLLTLSAVACTYGFYAPVPHLHLMLVLVVPPPASLQLRGVHCVFCAAAPLSLSAVALRRRIPSPVRHLHLAAGSSRATTGQLTAAWCALRFLSGGASLTERCRPAPAAFIPGAAPASCCRFLSCHHRSAQSCVVYTVFPAQRRLSH